MKTVLIMISIFLVGFVPTYAALKPVRSGAYVPPRRDPPSCRMGHEVTYDNLNCTDWAVVPLQSRVVRPVSLNRY